MYIFFLQKQFGSFVKYLFKFRFGYDKECTYYWSSESKIWCRDKDANILMHHAYSVLLGFNNCEQCSNVNIRDHIRQI
jgi:hypothetical protein